jgi:ABC-type proline/glycine betaine transport system permease subunit
VFPPRGEIIATVCSWLAAIAAAALGFWLTEGASYHQLAIAVLSALISLAVVLALLDTLWRLLGHALGARARRRESPGSA